jgi:hypothetical protein
MSKYSPINPGLRSLASSGARQKQVSNVNANNENARFMISFLVGADQILTCPSSTGKGGQRQ